MKNRGWFYSGIAQVITTFLCAHLKAILTEEIQTNNWVEIQTQRTPRDCVECLTVHKRVDDKSALEGILMGQEVVTHLLRMEIGWLS
jgi:hypothetical protein